MRLSFILFFLGVILITSIFSINDVYGAGYIKFDGVDGETQDKDHKGWSDLLSFTESSNIRDDSTSNRNQYEVLDIVIVKELDKSSPKLAESIAMGKVFPKVEIHLISNEGHFFAYELTNVMITNYSISGSEKNIPTEEISLNYEKITLAEKSENQEKEKDVADQPNEEPIQESDETIVEDVAVPPILQDSPKVPEWVQTTAQFWINNDVSDREFTDALGFLVREQIIEVEVEIPTDSTEQITEEPQVPDWISTTTGWWINGEVPEDQFLEGIKWMIKNRIIRGV